LLTIRLRSEENVRQGGAGLADRRAPNLPELRMLVRPGRVFVRHVDDAAVRKQLPHPFDARRSRYLLRGQTADQNGHLVDVMAREVDQVLVASMRREELAQD